MENNLIIAVTTGLIGMFGWGLSDFLSAFAMKRNKVNEHVAVFYIYLVTTLILLLIFLLSGQQFEYLTLEILIEITLLAFINVCSYFLFYRSLRIGSLGVNSSIFSTYAIGSTLISVIFFSEGINLFRFISLSVVVIGIVLLSFNDIKGFKMVKGAIFAILAALLLAIFFPIFNNFLSNHHGDLFWTVLIDFIITIFFFINLIKYKKRKILKLKFNKNLVIAGIANSFALVALTWGFKLTSLTSVITVISSAVPLVSVVLGYFVFKEKFSGFQRIGIFLILIGTILISLS